VQPIGPGGLEDVTLFRRTAEGMLVRVCSLLPARFVPLYGRHGFGDGPQ
jgi:protein-L-isoaspartate(D-aspartate) O-methyltransferase